MPDKNFPLNNSLISSVNDMAVLDAISVYLACGQNEKGVDLADRFVEETMKHIKLLAKPYGGSLFSWEKLQNNLYYLIWVADTYKTAGLSDKSKDLRRIVNSYLKTLTGQSIPEDEEDDKDTTAAV